MVQIEAPSTPGCQDSIPSQGGQHREEHRVVHSIQEEHYDGHIQWAWVIVTDVHGSGWSPKYSWVSAKSSQVVSERKNMGYQRKLLTLSHPLSTVHRRSPLQIKMLEWTMNQTMHQTMHWTMNRTINGTMNRTMNHKPGLDPIDHQV